MTRRGPHEGLWQGLARPPGWRLNFSAPFPAISTTPPPTAPTLGRSASSNEKQLEKLGDRPSVNDSRWARLAPPQARHRPQSAGAGRARAAALQLPARLGAQPYSRCGGSAGRDAWRCCCGWMARCRLREPPGLAPQPNLSTAGRRRLRRSVASCRPRVHTSPVLPGRPWYTQARASLKSSRLRRQRPRRRAWEPRPSRPSQSSSRPTAPPVAMRQQPTAAALLPSQRQPAAA